MEGLQVIGLISGGKDSVFNLMECVRHGHNIVALGNLYPPPEHPSDELDSWVFQTVGHDAVAAYAHALGVPMVRCAIRGTPKSTGCEYARTEGDETEDLFRLLAFAKRRFPRVQAVASGAILSTYQRLRIEDVCARLGLVSLSYLWQCDQRLLLRRMVDSSLHAVLIKVAAYGLRVDRHLGKSIADMRPHLERMHEDFGLHICGEGGEYETFTLDCPLFRRALQIKESEVVLVEDNSEAPVAHLHLGRVSCSGEEKQEWQTCQPTAAEPFSLPAEVLDVDMHVSEGEEEAVREEAPSVLPQVTAEPLDCVLQVQGSLVRDPLWCVARASARHEDPAVAMTAALLAVQDWVRYTAEGALSLDQHGVHCMLVLDDMANFQAANAAYVRFFGLHRPPSRACFSTTSEATVAVEVWLCGDGSGEQRESLPTRCLHVQSISEWAPACIGPYSQAVVRHGALGFLAGQIGLLPGSMKFPEPAEASPGQLRLACQHVEAVMRVLGLHPAQHVASMLVLLPEEPGDLSLSASADAVRDALCLPAWCPVHAVRLCGSLPRGAALELYPVVVDGEAAGKAGGHIQSPGTMGVQTCAWGDGDVGGGGGGRGGGGEERLSPPAGRTPLWGRVWHCASQDADAVEKELAPTLTVGWSRVPCLEVLGGAAVVQLLWC